MQTRLREIQHFAYCAHRWGLMELDSAWAENAFVVKANLLHERVHNPDAAYAKRGKKVLTGLSVYCDDPAYDMYGVLDCLECTPCADGAVLNDGSRYQLCIVEYKPTMPKNGLFREADALQVFAQKICVDSMFGCHCTAALYYADKKRRVELPFATEYASFDARLRQTLAAIRAYRDSETIPQREQTQQCSGCSLKDLCLPIVKQRQHVRATIAQLLEREV